MRQEAEQLQGVNASLRLRLAALQLSWRVQTEVFAHQQQHAALLSGQAAPEDLGAVEAHLQAHILEALADLGGAAGTDADAGDVGATLSCVAHSRGLSFSLPHLATGRSLLHLSSATSEDISWARGCNMESLHAAWACLVAEARGVQERAAAAQSGTGDGEAAHDDADLEAIGARMQRFFTMTCVHAFELFALGSVTHSQTKQQLHGAVDAPLSYWEEVIRAARMSTVQAMLMIEVNNAYRTRIVELHAERAELSELLGDANTLGPSHAAAPSPPPPARGPAAMERGAGGDAAANEGSDAESSLAALAFENAPGVEQDAEEHVIALEANAREERSAWQAFASTSCALYSPSQWAKLCVAAYPYPFHAPSCCRVLEHFVKFEPGAFVD